MCRYGLPFAGAYHGLSKQADLDEVSQVCHAGRMQHSGRCCGGHAEQQVLAQGGSYAEQAIHAGLPWQGLQNLRYLCERHCQQQLPLIVTGKTLHEPKEIAQTHESTKSTGSTVDAAAAWLSWLYA